MAAPTEVYVDPAIAADSGTGTIGDPYGDLQYALNTVTRDATNGNRFNIKAGTDEVLAAALSLATYGTPGNTTPVIFQGYTAAAGDGGIGGISGGGSVAIINAGVSYINFVDMHLHNCGAAAIVTMLSFGWQIIGCELDNTSGDAIVTGTTTAFTIAGCHIHDIGAAGVNINSASATGSIVGNYFANGTKVFTAAIALSRTCFCRRNIITIGGASNGITTVSYGNVISNNSILSAGGTGKGVSIGTAGDTAQTVLNNLVEGFSGAGGVGIGTASDLSIYAGNAVYNNTTNYSVGDADVNLGDNETLGATPFAKSGSDTFANRAVYFAPLDVGNVRGGAFPTLLRLDKGAVQHADPAGGSGGVIGGPNKRAGMQ